MKPRFAFSTNAYTRFSLPTALKRIREIGFRAVEILADRPHAYAAELTARKISSIARRLDRLGLAVSTVNSNTAAGFFTDAPPEPFFEPSFISPRPEWRRFRIDYTRRAIDLAAATGAAAVTVTTGRMLGPVGPDRAEDLLLLALEAVLLHAERAGGVRVGVEYEPGLYVERADQLAALIDRVGHPLLGTNLDLGHALVAGDGISGAVKLLAGRTWSVHLEDLPGGRHYHLAPGLGDFPFAEAKRALAAAGYTGPLTWEIYTASDDPDAAARRALAFSRRKWPRL
ncbi:MAG: sugar phosphate isomerase/epimerase family protein [Planctomycetota bacterium]|jgi:sugar phosphate isomerase/epimerase